MFFLKKNNFNWNIVILLNKEQRKKEKLDLDSQDVSV